MSTQTHSELPTHTATNRSDDRDQSCPVCVQLRKQAPAAMHPSTIPSRIGGWVQWSALLLQLLHDIGNEPTRVVIIEQPHRNDRYVQMLVGHGFARVEASSNQFLQGTSRLSGVDERLLTLLGWQAPNTAARTPSPNWTLPLVEADWQNLVETITATVVGIFGFSEQLPVQWSIFAADHPCHDCSWPEDVDNDIDDNFGTLGF